MNYCPKCGQKVLWKIPHGDDRERAVCESCDYIHYENPRVLVAVFLYCNDKLMWTQRGIDPYKGRWAFPSGFLEKGETLQQAAARELYEETHIKLDAQQMVPMSLGSVLVIDQIYVVFRCRCEKEIEAALTEETLDWRWCNEADAPWNEMAHPETEVQVRQVYSWLQSGKFGMRVGEVTSNGGDYSVFPME